MQHTTEKITSNGLQRRIRQHLCAKPQTFFAICTVGMERFLEQELRACSAVALGEKTEGGIEFSGDFDLLHLANLNLRTANRILMRVDRFTAHSYPELYDRVSRIPWERYLGIAPRFRIECSAKKSRLHHDGNVAQSAGEGIIRKLTLLGTTGIRDEVSPLCVFIRLHDDLCTVSMDTTGELLHKRGYREAVAKAPLRESTAAALLMACEAHRAPVIADPMCGSGTFLIEAAQMALNMAPGLDRPFAFESWPSFGAPAWNHLKKKAQEKILPNTNTRFFAGDNNVGAIKATQGNASRAGVSQHITVAQGDCRKFNADGSLGKTALVISNLPFGKRLGEDKDLVGLYHDFGVQLKKACRGWRFGFLVPDDVRCEKALDLPVKERLKFSNGGLAVMFVMGRIQSSLKFRPR